MRALEPVIYTLYCFSVALGCSIVLELSQTEYETSNKTADVILLATMVVMSLGLVLVLKRVKDINHDKLLLFYVLLINVLVNIEKSFTINQPRSELVFYSAIACSFLCRLKSFFTVSVLCFVSSVCYFQLTFGNLLYRDEFDNLQLSFGEQVEAYFRIINTLVFLLVFILYAYWDESSRKVSFVINFRKQKEFQKSKQILNILVPAIVRSRIQEGQKNFSDAQGIVTIIFCDIEGFDDLV